MSESFAELFAESLDTTNLRAGSIIIGTVVGIDRDHVTVNAGLKSEGVIAASQFMDANGALEVAVDDQVEVVLETVEDGWGYTRLSREKAKRHYAWKKLEQVFASEEIITGCITGKVKGGFTVDLEQVRAFLPGSLVDMRPVRDTTHLEGKELEFKIIKLDQKRNNVVISRRAVIELEYHKERDRLLESMAEGQEMKGVVKNLTDYGAFVDLGGIDGLLHITDMAWRRVKHPSEVVQIGDEVHVKILKFDREKMRVSLGIKQTTEDPWLNLKRRYPAQTRLFGKITNITDYGAFVGIEDGVEGLVHISEMDWANKNAHPSKLVQSGQEVEVMVLDIDEERRRISLGMKQCQTNPWDEFDAQHKKGDQVSGVIKSITDFGVFIGLPGGIDGLVHSSDISWDENPEQRIRDYHRGQQVDAVVLAVDASRERISLGIKQLAKDPFSVYLTEHKKGSVVTGTVQSVEAKGAVIDLADGVSGYLRVAEISRERTGDATTALQVGNTIEAKLVNVDRKTRMIALSIKAKDVDEEQAVISSYSAGSATTPGATLADLFQDKFKSQ